MLPYVCSVTDYGKDKKVSPEATNSQNFPQFKKITGKENDCNNEHRTHNIDENQSKCENDCNLLDNIHVKYLVTVNLHD